jgi:hypothetical protein
MVAILGNILLAQIISCNCETPPSTLVVDEDGKCIYWYYNHEPDKHNPCIDVPGNAYVIWEEDNVE